jgi:hypothetical protein
MTCAGFVVNGSAQETQVSPAPAPNADFEELPELHASEILKPEFLKGPYHSVQENVPTESGANQYVIQSDFGVFEADGNAQLETRVKEIFAIAKLKEVSRTDQFKDALGNAAKNFGNSAKTMIKDPVNTISNAPKGVMKFMNRAGNSIKNIGKKDQDSSADGSKTEQMLGQAKTKRKIAVSMGIDPYSNNAVLQKELDGIAWASWAGGVAFSVGTMPIGGGIGAAITVTKVGGSLNQIVAEKPPADIKAMNRSALRAMGVSSGDTEKFLANTAFSPTQQAAFVLNLKELEGVANRGAFVHSAATKSSNEADALFCIQTAALLANLHESEHPLARIAMIGDFPVGIAKDGSVVVALQWDYAAWTVGASAFMEDLQKLVHESGQQKPALVAISGQMSPRLQQELQSRGITARDRISPGPLK